MTAVHIAGVGLVCAAGATLSEAVERVRSNTVKANALTIPTVDGERNVPYFSAPLDPTTDLSAVMTNVARAAIADAGLTSEQTRSSALIIGSSSLQIAETENRGDARILGGMNALAQRAKTELGLSGPDYTINTACTSSAHALLLARTLLTAGSCDTAIVIGVERANRTTVAGFQAMQLLGSAARPLDQARDGLVLGEAIAALVLTTKPARRRALFLGGANCVDISSQTGTDPSGAAMAQVMERALRSAGIEPSEISLIKAQAAGSKGNDPAEALSISRVFPQTPAVTSIKGLIGHVLGASGCAELALLLGCWEKGFTPGTAGCTTPDASLSFRPMLAHADWVPRRALLNYVGFGGGQASLVIELNQ